MGKPHWAYIRSRALDLLTSSKESRGKRFSQSKFGVEGEISSKVEAKSRFFGRDFIAIFEWV